MRTVQYNFRKIKLSLKSAEIFYVFDPKDLEIVRDQ